MSGIDAARAGTAAVGAVGGLALGRIAGYDPAALLVTGAFLAALALAAFEDLRTRRIPNLLTYTGTLGALTVAGIAGTGTLLYALGGVLVAGGFMLVISVVGRGRMGLGDVKLAAFAGAVIGPFGAPYLLLLSTALGGAAALVLLFAGRDRRSTFAYGPYLAAGAVLALLAAGGPIVR